MKKITSLFSAAALASTVVALVPACGASSRNNLTTSGPADSGAGDEPDVDNNNAFVDAKPPPKDAEDIFESCATAQAGTSTDPVVLEFVLDGSGSMDSDNKWTAATQALNAVFDDFLTKNDPKVAVGLIIFSDQNDPTNGDGPYPSSKDIYPQLVNQSQHDALTARINNTNASGGTPSYQALQGGLTTMLNYTAVPPAPPADQSRKVVVFMSDGVPNGGSTEQAQCVSAANGGSTEQAQCVSAAKNALNLPAPKGPIKTFSVGIGPFPGSQFSYDPKFMGDLAVAGGTRATPQCDPAATNINNVCHFQVTPNGKPLQQLKQEFIQALNRIRGIAVGCEFNIDADADAGSIDPSKVNVVWTDSNGQKHVVPQDDTDGWSFDDPNDPKKVVLNGQSCGDVSQDLGAEVKIVLGCKTIVN